MRRLALGLTLFGALVAATPARADVINAMDSGWYTNAGTHNAAIDNYLVGDFTGAVYHNFFVFDLTAVVDEIVSASIHLYNPDNALPGLRGYVSPDPTETYELYDVTTPIATLSATHVGAAGIAIHNEIGSGTVLGQTTASAADNGTTISIVLNADGLAALNAAKGGLFALGGAVTTLGAPGNEYIFGFSVALDNPDVRQLEFTTAVPEPATLTLLGIGAAFFGHRRVRRYR
jgi:hypothetical protein